MKSGHITTNGLRMYYEIHGEGRPLVLLHGALSATGSSFGKYIPDLAKTHQVIALEMQAHGHTADVDRPLRIRTLADDTVGALRELGVEEAAAPTLIAIGDSDVVPEHAVQMFRLLGGGVGDTPAGLPKSRLAVLPGTSHTMMVDRAEMLMPMLSTFLDDAS